MIGTSFLLLSFHASPVFGAGCKNDNDCLGNEFCFGRDDSPICLQRPSCPVNNELPPGYQCYKNHEICTGHQFDEPTTKCAAAYNCAGRQDDQFFVLDCNLCLQNREPKLGNCEGDCYFHGKTCSNSSAEDDTLI